MALRLSQRQRESLGFDFNEHSADSTDSRVEVGALSTFEISGASASTVRSALLLALQPDGKGGIPGFNMNGHAANVNNGFPAVASSPGATYTVAGDGSAGGRFGQR